MKASPKTVVLYIGMIGFIVISFSFISVYGTENLRAPTDIAGQYALTTAVAPDCFGDKPPILVIGQSGSYLNADLAAADLKKDKLTRALKGNGALNGQIAAGKIQLAGKPKLGTCKEPQPLTLTLTVLDGQVQGQLRLGNKVFPVAGKTKAAQG